MHHDETIIALDAGPPSEERRASDKTSPVVRVLTGGIGCAAIVAALMFVKRTADNGGNQFSPWP